MDFLYSLYSLGILDKVTFLEDILQRYNNFFLARANALPRFKLFIACLEK